MTKVTHTKQVLIALFLIGGTTFAFGGVLWPKELGYESRQCKTNYAEYKVAKINIEHKNYKLLISDTNDKHWYGLMNVKEKSDICGHDGMIFLFKDFGIQTFWNKNTLVDLDLYWMANDKMVRKDLLQNITDNGMRIYSSLLPVNRVVEIIAK